MKLTRAIAQFTDELKLAKSPSTVRGYGTDLMKMTHYVGSRRDTVLAFTPELIQNYLTALSQQGMTMRTLHRKATALRAFGEWGVRRGLWVRNPANDPAFRFRCPDPVPKPFDEDEIQKLLDLPLVGLENVVRALLYYTGLRVTPICHLRLCDLSFAEPGMVHSQGKGRRITVVPMAAPLRSILVDWLAANPGKPYDTVLRKDGRSLTRRTVERMTREWGETAGVPNCHPHRFRHTFATRLLRRGTDVRVVQKLLGHASIQTTMTYTKVADEQLVDAILKLEP